MAFQSRYAAEIHMIGETKRLKIEGLGSLGEGLSRIDGKEIFIPKTAPFDECEVLITEEKKGRLRGVLKNILKPGALRISAPCEHFENCGGCDFQHLPYEEQLAWKLRMTKHWIRRSSLAPLLEKINFDLLPSPQPYHYRHRVRLQVKDGKLHFFKPHSNQLLHIRQCPILVEGFFEALEKEAQSLPDTKDWNQSFLEGRLVKGSASYEMDGKQIQFGSECFTQGNLEVNRLLWKRVEQDVKSLPVRHTGVDLFCGVGNFTLPLKPYFKRLIAAENFAPSIDWARRNSSEIEWHCKESHELLDELLKERMALSYVLLDPPRTGALEVARRLVHLSPPFITYVSCNLETLIHDLVILHKKGHYHIHRWTIADMFPQTHHIESVVSLSLSASAS